MPTQKEKEQQKERLKKAYAYWDKRVEPLIKAVKDSERLTAEDYATRINI